MPGGAASLAAPRSSLRASWAKAAARPAEDMAARIWVQRPVGRAASQTALTAWATAHRPMAALRPGRAGAFHTRRADRVVAEKTAGRIRLKGPRGRSVIGPSRLRAPVRLRVWGGTARVATTVAARAKPTVSAAPRATWRQSRPSALRKSAAWSRAASRASSMLLMQPEQPGAADVPALWGRARPLDQLPVAAPS